jgi:hypothetical protein
MAGDHLGAVAHVDGAGVRRRTTDAVRRWLTGKGACWSETSSPELSVAAEAYNGACALRRRRWRGSS